MELLLVNVCLLLIFPGVMGSFCLVKLVLEVDLLMLNVGVCFKDPGFLLLSNLFRTSQLSTKHFHVPLQTLVNPTFTIVLRMQRRYLGVINVDFSEPTCFVLA